VTYSVKDLERADRFTLANPMVSNAAVAQLIADARRDALEEAAKICDPFMRNEALSVQERDVAEWIHARIRALKDGAK
jgi:hypothetical protein